MTDEELEVEHLAGQCSVLLRENEKLRDALQAIAVCGAERGKLTGHDAENMALIARAAIAKATGEKAKE